MTTRSSLFFTVRDEETTMLIPTIFLFTRKLIRSFTSHEITWPVRVSRLQGGAAAALLGITAMLVQPSRAQGAFPSSSPQDTTSQSTTQQGTAQQGITQQGTAQSPSSSSLGTMGASQGDGSQDDLSSSSS